MSLPKFWSTHIAKVVIGEQPCLLSPWASGHLPFEKRVREDQGTLARWKADHSAQLQAHAETLRAIGWKLDLERFFRVTGATAVVSGKADIVAQQKDRRPLIVDIKSGTPRDSDVAQVLLEMVLIPLAWNAPTMIFEGAVVYPTHTVPITPKQAEEFRPRLMATIRRLGSDVRPEANPGRDACRWCELPESVCAVRHVEEQAGETAEF